MTAGRKRSLAIAGHRTTYGAPFNRIDELKPGDEIIVLTLQGRFVYKVLESPADRRAGDEGGTWGPGWFAVKPNDVSVLAPTDDNRLTLTACHPKYSAKLRIIVQAKLVAEPAEAPTTTVPTTDPATGADGTDDAQTVTPPLETTEDLIAGDPGELAPALLFGGIVIALWLGSMALAALFRRREMRWWPIYIVTTVATVAPLWFCFVHMDRFLPSY